MVVLSIAGLPLAFGFITAACAAIGACSCIKDNGKGDCIGSRPRLCRITCRCVITSGGSNIQPGTACFEKQLAASD